MKQIDEIRPDITPKIKKTYAERGCRDIGYKPNRKMGGKRVRDKTKLIGQRFGKLTVIKWTGINNNCDSMWNCECECGNNVNVSTSSLKRKPKGKRKGGTKSCGCLHQESVVTHGKSYTHTYKSWHGMIERCNNPNHSCYKYYGGRGIKVCERWRNSYEDFLKDMGERPKGTSIDRIDVNGNYCSENCRWLSHEEQSFNKTNNVMLTYNGETLCAKQWANKLNIPYRVLYSRIQRNWTTERALTMPVMTREKY